MIRTYTELLTLPTFEERLKYLKLHGEVGDETFGYDRYLNQLFYRSPEWRMLRNQVITRDYGCDMALPEFEILDEIVVHHMNPIQKEDVLEHSEILMNPEYLVCVSDSTHRAIHYGDEAVLFYEPVERRPNDMIPWR